MKEYDLVCPNCNSENVYILSSDPATLYCIDCEDEVDLEIVRRLVVGWKTYLEDLDKFLKTKEEQPHQSRS